MTLSNHTSFLSEAVEALSDPQSCRGLLHRHRDGDPLPSAKALRRAVELTRSLVFPGYFGIPNVNSRTLKYHTGVMVEELYGVMAEQILAAFCFDDTGEDIGTLRLRAADCARCLPPTWRPPTTATRRRRVTAKSSAATQPYGPY